MKLTKHVYGAHVDKVYDGDTVTLTIDLGCWTKLHNEKCRLFGINTPEVRGVERPEGLVSRDKLRELILGKDVTIKTNKDKTGKYGRLLVDIYLDDLHINKWLIDEGLALEANY